MVKVKRRGLTSLNIWVNGKHAGVWTVRPHSPQEFQYSDEWVTASYGRMLSLSLAFQPGNASFKGAIVENYFDNLLPDSKNIRNRIGQNYHTNNTTPFALLSAIGRDCVGAIQLLPEGEEPIGWDTIRVRPLSNLEIEQQLNAALSENLSDDASGEFRISIAGAQEKTALTWHDNQWCAPIGMTPTTHIMKLPIGLIANMGSQIDMSASIENEWICSKIMTAFSIETAHCEIATFGKTKVLVVRRFDRKRSSDKSCWLRLPQEDMCQALGLPPHAKYESDGGVGMRDVLELLRGSSHAHSDRRRFYKAQILFWMLAATDGHGKNFSLFHEVSGYKMTPLYDVLSSWPIQGEAQGFLSKHRVKMAMAFRSKNAHYKMKDIYPNNLYAGAVKLGLGEDVMLILEEVVKEAPRVVDNVKLLLPKGFPQAVSEPIFAGLLESANKIKKWLVSRN